MPPFPDALRYVWDSYLRIRRRLSLGFASANPLGWTDLEAFSSLTGLKFAPWELRLIEAIDDAYLKPEPSVSVPESGEKKVVRSVFASSNGEGVKSLMSSVGNVRVVVRTNGKVST